MNLTEFMLLIFDLLILIMNRFLLYITVTLGVSLTWLFIGKILRFICGFLRDLRDWRRHGKLEDASLMQTAVVMVEMTRV